MWMVKCCCGYNVLRQRFRVSNTRRRRIACYHHEKPRVSKYEVSPPDQMVNQRVSHLLLSNESTAETLGGTEVHCVLTSFEYLRRTKSRQAEGRNQALIHTHSAAQPTTHSAAKRRERERASSTQPSVHSQWIPSVEGYSTKILKRRPSNGTFSGDALLPLYYNGPRVMRNTCR